MQVEAEVKITILDGEEKGRVESFTTTGETESQYTEIGIIERLILEWNHICLNRSIRVNTTESEVNEE